jgi:hypothetical protein
MQLLGLLKRANFSHCTSDSCYLFVRERRGMHIGYWWESQKEKDNYAAQDVGGWTILK